ncbi:uncharacterized protein [Procambarus clarkii]|uniref:uncharacterized protein n=1 Tax=Procambarus clarkii TaxID=6728 RepID=UPI0037440AED
MLRVVLVVCLAVCVLSQPSPQGEEKVVHDCTKCNPNKCLDVSSYCRPGDTLVKNECGCLVCSELHGDLTHPHHDHCINSGDNHDVFGHNHTEHDSFCCGLGHEG